MGGFTMDCSQENDTCGRVTERFDAVSARMQRSRNPRKQRWNSFYPPQVLRVLTLKPHTEDIDINYDKELDVTWSHIGLA